MSIRAQKVGNSMEHVLFKFRGKIDQYIAAEHNVLVADMVEVFLQVQFFEGDHLFNVIIDGPNIIVVCLKIAIPEVFGQSP